MATKKNASGKAARKPSLPRPESWVMDKQELIHMLAGNRTLVQRMLEASRNGNRWLEIVGNAPGKGGGRTLVTRRSALEALDRIATKGEFPPLMRSERGRKKADPKVATLAKGLPSKQGQTLMQAHDLLPKRAELVVFRPGSKTFTIQWEDGEFQYFRISSPRGRRRELRELTFQPIKLKEKPDKPKPERCYGDEPGID